MISDDNFVKELQAIGLSDDAEFNYLALPVSARDALLDDLESSRKHPVKVKIPSEKTEQIDLVYWFRSTYPGHVIMSIRNDGSRTPQEKSEQKLLGVHPGASDLCIPFLSAWVEMKRVDGGAGLSNVQKEFQMYITRMCGQRYFQCNGAEQAKKVITEMMDEITTVRSRGG